MDYNQLEIEGVVMKYNLRQILLTVLIVFLVFGLMHVTLQSYEVNLSSMESNFHDGQRVLVEKVTYRFHSPNRGDVIVFDPPTLTSDPYIKRIIGLPGETIEIRDGEIFIDGRLLEETSDFFSQIPESDSYPLKEIPEDQYFVLGDNRSHSSDSRDWGPVSREDIIGRVWIRYWPLGQLGFSPSYSYTLEEVG